MRSNPHKPFPLIVKPFRALLAALLTCSAGLVVQAAQAAELLLTLRSPESPTDKRQLYINAAVRLALEKTLASHGPYRLQDSPPMNKQRALLSARQKTQPNLMVMAGPGEAHSTGLLAPVRFPLMLGVPGYRVCFVSPASQQAVAQAKTLDELRNKFNVLQGPGWADTAVLQANGFHVTEGSGYEALFRMVAKGRNDLFCRSVLEVQAEAQAQADLPGLLLDRSFALVYDLPHFLYTHRDNKAVIDRLSQGFHQAYADGSLQALMRRHLQPSLQFVELHKRRIHQLRSTPPPGIDFEYRSYSLDLFSESR